MLKIILADDHALFRAGMKHHLKRLGEEISIFEADSHDATLRLLAEHPDADLALVDLHMPGRADDLSGLTDLLDQTETVPVVVLSGSENFGEVHQVIKAGAMGFIPKHEHVDVMLCALQLVLSGSVYIPPLLMSSQSSGRTDAPRLTPKQFMVLQQLCKGCSNKEIGLNMHLSEATIKGHISAIFRELNVRSRTEAVSIAKQRGLIT
ncbi:MAG: response regulator transcription factor [Gallionella sp.]